MTFRPNYVPKTKKKLNYKVVVPLVVLFALVAYFLASLVMPPKEAPVRGYAICNLSDYASRKRIESEQENLDKLETLPVSDYGVYGESLSLYQNHYSYKVTDPMVGKIITLTNVCDTTQQFTFLMGGELDLRIPMDQLPVGFYSIDVLSDLKHYALVSGDTVSEMYETVVRGGVVKQVTIQAKQDLFDLKEEKVLNKNYVFLEVKETEPTQEVYDVVLDPRGGSKTTSGAVDFGARHQGLVERDEMYTTAVEVQKILEAQGLRVHVTRDNETPISIYGVDGRIHNAYQHNAKYYIAMSFESSGSAMDRGIMSLYSNFASNRFSVSVVQQLLSATSLQATPYDDGTNMRGVFQTRKTEGYDLNDIVRETGAKFTGAGDTDPYFIGMHDFAKTHNRGMYGITLLYGYMTDPDDFKVWQEERQKIAEATAQGILDQLHIVKQGE